MEKENEQELMEQVNEVTDHEIFTVSTMNDLYSVLSLIYLKQNGSLPKPSPVKPKPARRGRKKKSALQKKKQD